MDLENERLLIALAHWQTVGDAIMTCVRGTPGPLSDSDVIGEITSLRAENERLRTEIARLRGLFKTS